MTRDRKSGRAMTPRARRGTAAALLRAGVANAQRNTKRGYNQRHNPDKQHEYTSCGCVLLAAYMLLSWIRRCQTARAVLRAFFCPRERVVLACLFSYFESPNMMTLSSIFFLCDIFVCDKDGIPMEEFRNGTMAAATPQRKDKERILSSRVGALNGARRSEDSKREGYTRHEKECEQ
jgi:hypothetical protein